MRCASEEETTKIFLHRTGGEDAGAARTLRRSTERRPLRMHSLSPVPSTMTSYSMSMAAAIGSPGGRRVIGGERERGRGRVRGNCGSPTARLLKRKGGVGGKETTAVVRVFLIT